MRKVTFFVVAAGLIAAVASSALADVHFQDLGTVAPPAALSGWAMTAFPLDGRPVSSDVTDVTSPLGGTVDFSTTMSHRRIGDGWATWSHGYTGDVYWTKGALTVTMTMPADTAAFYFYAEPNPFSSYTITATATDGTTSGPISVSGSAGAQGYGFYTSHGQVLSSIEVVGGTDFAVGEFGIAAVPAPGAVLLGAMGLGMVGWLKRRKDKVEA